MLKGEGFFFPKTAQMDHLGRGQFCAFSTKKWILLAHCERKITDFSLIEVKYFTNNFQNNAKMTNFYDFSVLSIQYLMPFLDQNTDAR